MSSAATVATAARTTAVASAVRATSSTSAAAVAVATSSSAAAVINVSSLSSSIAAAATASSLAASSLAASSLASSSAAAFSSSSISSASAASSSSLASSISASASKANAPATAIIGASSNAASTSSHTALSGGVIGAIAGGIVGGLILVVLGWQLWKRCRDRKHRVQPPPPRDVTFIPTSVSRHHLATSPMISKGDNRASMYSNQSIMQARPPSTYNSHSRQPSYSAYPISPASYNNDASPPMPPSTSSNESSESPPLTAQPIASGSGTGPSTGVYSPAKKPSLAPITTTLRRQNSSSSGSGEMGQLRPKSSVDRLKESSAPGPSRPPSPNPLPSTSEQGSNSSRTNSPHPSSGTFPRVKQTSLSPSGYPRPSSMASLSSSRYFAAGPQGGAPHQGRPVNLQMPQLLGARPNHEGDFFWGANRVDRPEIGFGDLDEHSRMSSQNFAEQGYGGHMREPSRSALPPPGPTPEMRERERPADPRVVLGRDVRDGSWV